MLLGKSRPKQYLSFLGIGLHVPALWTLFCDLRQRQRLSESTMVASTDLQQILICGMHLRLRFALLPQGGREGLRMRPGDDFDVLIG